MKAEQFLQVLICLTLLASCTPVVPSPTAVLSSATNTVPATPAPAASPTAPTSTRRPWRTPTPTEPDEIPTDEPATPTVIPTVALPPRIENPNWTRAGQPLPAGLPVISPENAARLSWLAVWAEGATLNSSNMPVAGLSDRKGGVRALDFSPNGQLLAYTDDSGKVWVLDAHTGEVKKIFEGHTQPVKRLAFSPDGRTIATGGLDRTIRLWDVQTGTGSILWEADDWIEQLAWSPDSQYIAYNCYECEEPEFIHIVDDAYYPFITYHHLNSFQFVDDENLAVPEGYLDDGYGVSFIQVGYAKPENTIDLEPFNAYCFAVAPERQKIATCSDDLVRVANAQDGKTILQAPTQKDTGELQSVMFSPDGRLIFATGKRGSGAWDSKTGALLQIFPFYNIDVSPTYDFSPNGTLFAYGNYDGSILIYGVLPSIP